MSRTRSTMRHANGKQDVIARRISQAVSRALTEKLLLGLGSGAAPDGPALTVEPAATPVAPARLAELQPGGAAAREATRAMYEQFLHSYRTIARAHGAGSMLDDAGEAVAFFVAACFNALRGIDANRHLLAVLERQLRGPARLASHWESAATAERQYYFELMAVLGVLVAARAARARTTSKAELRNVQDVARGYLRQLFGVDPDTIELGDSGLMLRQSAGEARCAA